MSMRMFTRIVHLLLKFTTEDTGILSCLLFLHFDLAALYTELIL